MNKQLPIHMVLENLADRVSNIPVGDPLFEDPRYHAIKFRPEHFHPIDAADSSRTLCFIDGGNVSIVRAPNFVVELTRLHSCQFNGQEKTQNPRPNRIEFYTICCAASENNQIIYETEFISVNDEWRKLLPDPRDLRFNSFDDTLMTGRQRASIDRVADCARLFAEWSYAQYLIEHKLEANDIVVKDGTLQTSITNEAKYANSTYEAAMQKGIIFSGLAKTSRLFTTTGYPLLSSIGMLAEQTDLKTDSWYYHPIVDIAHPDHRAELFAVKLQKNSEYVFRFEILRDQFQNMGLKALQSVIGTVALNSVDICFPGYPYGLIEADQLARVTEREKDSYKVQFMSAAASSDLWSRISRHLKCIDAHSLLDTLAGE